MDSKFIQPEPAFANIAFSVGRDPKSWDRWSCLQIEIQPEKIVSNVDGVSNIKSLVNSYFGHLDGRVFFVHNEIYVICRNISASILQELGQQLCQMRFGGQTLFVQYHAFDLNAEADEFLASLHSKKHCDPDSLEILKKNDKENPPLSGIGETKIMLVEDDPIARWLVSNALKGHCSLATASCAHKAYDIYTTWQPNLVFLDIGLPDADGYSVLQWILNNDPGASVIMVSASSGMDNIASALDRGAKGFIAKPFVKEKLFHYIRKHGT